jgi:hypothetical protein
MLQNHFSLLVIHLDDHNYCHYNLYLYMASNIFILMVYSGNSAAESNEKGIKYMNIAYRFAKTNNNHSVLSGECVRDGGP